jgi:hypothetical protein
MGQRDRTWLGWPLWLVSAALVLAAVTGSAGPVAVIWALGTISVTAWVVWSYLRGWIGSARRGGQPSEGEQPSRPSDEDSQLRRTDAGPNPG